MTKSKPRAERVSGIRNQESGFRSLGGLGTVPLEGLGAVPAEQALR